MRNNTFVNVKNGTSLVETILAIAIVAFIVPALIVLGVVSLRSNNNAERRSEASKLASSAIEAVKYVRDNDGCGLGPFLGLTVDHPAYLKLDTGSTDPGVICGVFDEVYGNPFVVVIPNTAEPENTYQRTIKISRYLGSSDTINVEVAVYWGDHRDGNSVVQSAIVNSLTAY